MEKRGLSFVILSILLLILSPYPVFAENSGCCISQANGCQDNMLESACQESADHTFVPNIDCSSITTDECNLGCCCENVAKNNVNRIQCIGTFNEGIFTPNACDAKCNTTVAPAITPGGQTQETAAPAQPGITETPAMPSTPAVAFYESLCGNNAVDLYEECDGTIDTRAEGARTDCQNLCGASGSDRPCRCPLTCVQNPAAPILQKADPQPGQKKIALSWTLPVTSCQPNYVFVQRCEGECNADSNWQQISSSLLVNTFIDELFAYNQAYSYRIGAYYEKSSNFAATKYSNIIFVGAIDEFCIKTNAASTRILFCKDLWTVQCNAKNQVEAIFDCGLRTNGVCIAGQCKTQGLCDACSKPFGIFLEPSCGTTCYKDSGRFSVDSYFQCKGVASCYDYKSRNACNLNSCAVPACEWMASESTELSIGVCRPRNLLYQDCGKCTQPNNPLLGGCDAEMCSAVGADCYYTNHHNCINKLDMACVYYVAEDECVGAQKQALSLDLQYDDVGNVVSGQNKIAALSDDMQKLGRCRWTDRCIKDADADNAKDCNDNFNNAADLKCQSDNVAPQTFVREVPVMPSNIELPVSVFDNVYSGSDITTYYVIAKEWTYPTYAVRNSKIIKTIAADDFYILTYYSEDKAHNLEEVKSMRFFVDGQAPTVTVDYDYTPVETGEDNWTSKVDVAIKATDNVDSLVACSAELINGPARFFAIDKLEDELISERTIHYSGVPDGYNVFHYECRDKAGNIDSGSVQITVEGDRSLTQARPNTALNYHTDIELGVTSAKASACKYSTGINNFDYMENQFSTVDGIVHTAIVSADPQLLHHRYYVKCKITDTGAVVGGKNDEIRFTVDEIAPVTSVKDLSGTCAANWMHSNFEMVLDCLDQPQRRQDFPAEFGCSKTYYCTGVSCSSFREYTSSVTITETTPISYYSVDAGGNSEAPRKDAIRIDTDKPYVSISILDSVTGVPLTGVPINRITPEPYIVEIISTKPLERINSFGFALSNNKEFMLPRPYPVNADKTKWQTLLVPTQFPSLNTQAFFGITARAEHGWSIEKIDSGDVFFINTLQQTPQVSTPSIGSVQVSSVSAGNSTLSSSIENNRKVYYAQESSVIIKGAVSNLLSLSYYLGSERRDVPVVSSQFEISLQLSAIEGAALETFVYFVGTDTQNKLFSDSVSFVLDRQGPEPAEYEVRETSTPLPNIIVDYGEDAEVLSYGITEFDGVNVSVQRMNARQYSFNIMTPLSNGCYKLWITAKDKFGNTAPAYEIPFGIEAADTRIILEVPHHGVSQVKSFDMVVKTTWAAKCKYGYIDPGNNFDHPLLLNFDTTGLLTHTKKGYKLDKPEDFYVICDDGRRVTKKAFQLRVDEKAPMIITAKADPDVVSQQSVNSKLIVETDEESTICKYSLGSSDYANMRYFPGESYDDPATYTKMHLKSIPFDPTPRSETYYVQCEDLSGRRSEVRAISFKVDDQRLSISVQNPPRYTSKKDISVNFTTNENAICRYKNGTNTWMIVDPPDTTSRTHSFSMGILRAGTYTMDLDCYSVLGLKGPESERDAAELAYTFTIDLTPPIMSSVSGGNYSCPKSEEYQLGISFNAYDNESAIASYIYDVVDSKGTIIIANQTSAAAQTTAEGLKLAEGEKYKVVASSFNGAGLESTTKESGHVLAKSEDDAECRERVPPSIGFRVAQSTGGVNVLMLCEDESGCDMDSYKYGTSTDTNCAPVKPYMKEVELSASMFFCGSACDSLGNCGNRQQKIDVLAGDADKDGVTDPADRCPDTAAGETVDAEGCSETQRYADADGDLVRDSLDQCPNTPRGDKVDAAGCSLAARTTETGSQVTVMEEGTSLLNWLLMILAVLAVLGIGGYIYYVQYYLPSAKTSLQPIKTIPRYLPTAKIEPIKRRSIEEWTGIKAGEDVFKALDRATGSKVFERLSSFVKRSEHDVFSTLEKTTKGLPRKAKGLSKDELFDQLTKMTSMRRAIKPEQPISELKKMVKRSKSKKK